MTKNEPARPAAVLRAELTREEYLGNYVDVPKYLGFCGECPNYGLRWSCPPYDFDPMDIWRSYDRLELLAWRIEPRTEEELTLAAKDAQAYLLPYYRGMVEELKIREAETPGSLRLNPGRCRLCAVCARESGEPCRFPEEMRWSIESLGGAVGDLTRDVLDLPLKWSVDGRPPEYYTLVGGLLKKEIGHAGDAESEL